MCAHCRGSSLPATYVLARMKKKTTCFPKASGRSLDGSWLRLVKLCLSVRLDIWETLTSSLSRTRLWTGCTSFSAPARSYSLAGSQTFTLICLWSSEKAPVFCSGQAASRRPSCTRRTSTCRASRRRSTPLCTAAKWAGCPLAA